MGPSGILGMGLILLDRPSSLFDMLLSQCEANSAILLNPTAGFYSAETIQLESIALDPIFDRDRMASTAKVRWTARGSN